MHREAATYNIPARIPDNPPQATFFSTKLTDMKNPKSLLRNSNPPGPVAQSPRRQRNDLPLRFQLPNARQPTLKSISSIKGKPTTGEPAIVPQPNATRLMEPWMRRMQNQPEPRSTFNPSSDPNAGLLDYRMRSMRTENKFEQRPWRFKLLEKNAQEKYKIEECGQDHIDQPRGSPIILDTIPSPMHHNPQFRKIYESMRNQI